MLSFSIRCLLFWVCKYLAENERDRGGVFAAACWAAVATILAIDSALVLIELLLNHMIMSTSTLGMAPDITL